LYSISDSALCKRYTILPHHKLPNPAVRFPTDPLPNGLQRGAHAVHHKETDEDELVRVQNAIVELIETTRLDAI